MSATYNNYHMVIDRQMFERHKSAGLYTHAEDSLKIKSIEPEYDLFMPLLKKYGHEWGWDRRPKYRKGRKEIEARLAHPETKLHLLQKDDAEIGYILITPPLSIRKTATMKSIIEIENFAISPTETGKRYGRYYLQEIFHALFKTYDVIYLTSRSTNHPGVIPFYKKMGMEVLRVDRDIPEDLMRPLEKISA